jgi:hypothetical protein
MISRKDRPGNDVLLVSVGAPNRVGNQYLAEEVLGSFMLENPEPVSARHLSAAYMHFWGTGRIVNILGTAPEELCPAVYNGLCPAFQPFAVAGS